MTPKEALAKAMKWTRVTTSQYDYTGMPPLPAQVMQRLNESGYSLVPTADLDRLRAAPLDEDRLAKALPNWNPSLIAQIARKYNAALGDRAAEEGRTEFAWLIERGQPERQVPTVWWWLASGGREGWTEDATKAFRFDSREAAEEIIAAKFTPRQARYGGPSARAVEHGFLGDRAAEEGRPECPRCGSTGTLHKMGCTYRAAEGGR